MNQVAFQERIFPASSTGRKAGRGVARLEFSILMLIVLNVIAVILGTIEQIATRYATLLSWFETFSVIVFSLEYVVRLWAAKPSHSGQHPVIGRLKYAVSFTAVVDLLAILPFFLPMFIPFDLRMLRAIRLIRIVRLLKMGRYSESLILFGRILRDKRYELQVSLVCVVVLLALSSSFMYAFEHDTQPEKFSSIPATMWWGIATLTTVGYGDVYPVTAVGKIFGAIVALFGIGLFALPAGILASGFSNALHRRRAVACPRCGHIFDNAHNE